MLLLDGQVHHDTHVLPMGNYVIAVGNYVIVSPSELGNYKIADKQGLGTLQGPKLATTRRPTTRRNHHPGGATIHDERPASRGQFR